MWNKIITASFVMVTLLCFFTGCVQDSRELDQRSLIMGIAIDKGENKLFSVTIQLPLFGEAAGGASVGPYARDFETFTGEGDTFWDAMRELESRTPTVLFLGHLKAVAISEEIAKNYVRSVLDFLERETAVSKQIYLLVIEGGTAREFIETESPLVQLPAVYLNQYFKSGQKIARTTDVKLFEFHRDSNMISGAATIPLARIQGENIFDIEGLAVFQDYILKGKLQKNQVAMSELMKDDSIDGMNETITIKQEEGEVEVSLTRIELKQNMHYKKTNPVQISLAVKGKGEIVALSDVQAKVSNETLKEISGKMSKAIEVEMKKTIDKMQAINLEPWLFGHRIWMEDPSYFETLNWNEDGWQNAQFQIDVEFDIKNSGQRGYLDKKKIGR